MIKAVLFDLDGTLLDTAEDLGRALNSFLSTRKEPPLSISQIRPMAGSGCKGLLKLGLDMDEHHPDYRSSCEELLALYQHHLFDTTQLFPGMAEVLACIEKNGLPWGVVTNKPAKFTDQLMGHLKLVQRAGCVISGDTLKNHKPHPEPILHACQILQQHPSDCLYIGDSKVDVVACKAAGSISLAALYGYIPANDDPATWQADGYIQHPSEIIRWLGD